MLVRDRVYQHARANAGLPPIYTPGPIEDFSFGTMEYYYFIERLATAYEKHGILPDAGGMLDQDQKLMDDIHLWLAIYGEEYQSVLAEMKRE